MRNKLHDGPSEAFEILNGRVRRPSGKPRASLTALQWAAERAGLSYGVFTQRLTPEIEARIQIRLRSVAKVWTCGHRMKKGGSK